MSRIHEALKKAQEERETAVLSPAPGPETTQSVAPPFRSEMGRAAESSREVATAVLTAPTILTAETLQAQCPQREWKPDPRATLSETNPGAREVFRTLRSRLYQMRDQMPLRTLLVASALPEEGKTFVASNLAQSIVRQSDRRVLLIDADLRRAQLSNFWGVPKTPGLVDYLTGEADEVAILQRGTQRSLFFVPAGKLVQNATELLSNGRFSRLLNDLGPLFDWIIVDSAPTIPVADARVVAGFCDGVLMVVRAGKTPFDIAQKACQSFHNKPVVGVILNKVDAPRSGSSYLGTYDGN